MKKVIIIFLLVLISCTIYQSKEKEVFIEKINLDLKKEEIGLIFIPIKKNRFLLIRSKERSALLPVIEEDDGDPSKVLEILGEGQIEYSYYNKIEGKYNVSLDIKHKLDNILIGKDRGNIKIQMGNQNFCIYKEGSLEDCDYVYFLKPAKLEKNGIKLAFYEDEADKNFENELYSNWIDLYKIKKNEFTMVKFNSDNYNVIRLPGYYFKFS